MSDRRRRFEAQVLPHLDGAYRFARWLARSPEGVEDVVQEAVLRAYRGFDGLRDADARAWFMAIVRNCHATLRLREQRQAAEPLPDEFADSVEHALGAPAPDPEATWISREQAHTLAELLALLPEAYREVLVLREIEDMDYRQIAAVTGAPLGTVMSRLARARAALRKHWHEQRGASRDLP